LGKIPDRVVQLCDATSLGTGTECMERMTTRAADAAPAGLKTDLDLRQAAILGLLIGLWIGGPVFAVRRFLIYGRDHDIGQDAHAYWLTARIPHLYTAPPGTHDAFLYSPAFAQVIRPIAELPFDWFVAIMIAIDAACYAWLLAPLGWKWAVPLWFFLAQGMCSAMSSACSPWPPCSGSADGRAGGPSAI
jgi:hypothetical protein